jgi:hypothetical protein
MPFEQNDWAPATASAADLAEVKTTAKNKVKTYAQDSAPTAEAVGDLWMDTDNGDALYRWDGKDWVNVQDGSIAEAKKAADEAMQTAKDAATITITSSNGTIFKNSAISTVLTAHVYKGGVEVTWDAIAVLGAIKWYKDGSTTAASTGQTLTIDAGDVTGKATYVAQLEG